jgi:bacillithiol biosynthesis cysteine-adding enzyme BshC
LSDTIKYIEIPYFNTLIQAYLSKDKSVEKLFEAYPTWENFESIIHAKKFAENKRKVLVEALTNQYKHIDNKEVTLNNIQALSHAKTFTVTTGHQLNLFTGPLYFIYKITSTIKLAEQLKTKFPEYHFVPIYWMATEDHDWAEINHFSPDATQKITWDIETKNAVGKLHTTSLKEVYGEFIKTLPKNKHSEVLKTLFSESYLNENDLANATRKLVHSLFGKYGLVILDAQDSSLKQLFSHALHQEITEKTTYRTVSETNLYLNKNSFPIQVNPRSINLFYFINNKRLRIDIENDSYKLLGMNKQFSENELLAEAKNHPEKFSPNVVLRPVYQEVILPNLAYIGGAGEISYWLQLKKTFNSFKVDFPILILRNSATWIPEKKLEKWKKLKLNTSDLFLPEHELTKKVALSNFPHSLPDFESLKKSVSKTWEPVKEWTKQVDPTLTPSIEAEIAKQNKIWKHWEKKLHRVIKQKEQEKITQALNIYNALYYNNTPQERILNFSYFYSLMGEAFFEILFNNFDPLSQKWNIISY